MKLAILAMCAVLMAVTAQAQPTISTILAESCRLQKAETHALFNGDILAAEHYRETKVEAIKSAERLLTKEYMKWSVN